MKALILAAGFGTRLRPYTEYVPKPLFTLAGRTVLEMAMEKLARCGCTGILVNTHHLADRIQSFVEKKNGASDIDIRWIHEPTILDTGGAIANAKPFLDDRPFFVVNADIVSDIDLGEAYRFHLASGALATLVLHDREEFNMVRTDQDGYIRDFRSKGDGLAFTGIQVLSPGIFDHFPDTSGKKAFSSIAVYQALCPRSQVRAFVAKNPYWEDIGTPEAYRDTARKWIAAGTLGTDAATVAIRPLAGDGSDRTWYRANSAEPPAPDRSLVVSDHGISLPGSDTLAQLRSFVSIGHHLAQKAVPVPRILAQDPLSGMVALEDLGDTHLADLVNTVTDAKEVLPWYRQVIDRLMGFSQTGKQGFDPAWTCQTRTYSIDLILEKECRYFMDAFARGYLGRPVSYDRFGDEFLYIAENALKGAFQGLMHRDLQSKNIMIRNHRIYFIDFQSARLGPLQYDLASLLIDPYVTLPQSLQDDLLAYALERLDPAVDRQGFVHCFRFCRLTRNLQILGAFAFLSRVKGKKGFEAYIPAALDMLKRRIKEMADHPVDKLNHFIHTL